MTNKNIETIASIISLLIITFIYYEIYIYCGWVIWANVMFSNILLKLVRIQELLKLKYIEKLLDKS